MTSKKIITHCAPTLAGLKTANLFNEFYEDKAKLIEEIDEFNKISMNYGIKMVPLSFANNCALIYVYRLKDLENDLNNILTKEILSDCGYDSNDVHSSIKRLSDKVQIHDEFPHEIGLFLGYPPKDVKGFIDNHAQNYKCVGYWKVYDDEEKAIELFKKYRTCQRIFLNRIDNGYSLEQLFIQK